MITEFSLEVISQLHYYVYRLIDPRNGQTFYVGKGKGNRVFDHVKCAIAYYDGAEDIDEDDPNKLKIIHSIQEAGLEVIHVIQRWNLTEQEAFQVESALIDAYQGLSNIQSGHHSEYGVTNAKELEKRLSKGIYEEPRDFKYTIIKVRWWRLEEMQKDFPQTYRYEATRKYWRMRPRSVKDYPYVFSITDGIVREVYKVAEWHKSPNSERYEFTGEVAEESPSAHVSSAIASPIRIADKAWLPPLCFPKTKSNNALPIRKALSRKGPFLRR